MRKDAGAAQLEATWCDVRVGGHTTIRHAKVDNRHVAVSDGDVCQLANSGQVLQATIELEVPSEEICEVPGAN